MRIRMHVGPGVDLVHSSCLSLFLSRQACLSLGAASAQCTRQPSSCRRRGGSGSRLSCRGGHCERLFPYICRAATRPSPGEQAAWGGRDGPPREGSREEPKM